MCCYTKSPLRTLSYSGIDVLLCSEQKIAHSHKNLSTRITEFLPQSIPLKRLFSRVTVGFLRAEAPVLPISRFGFRLTQSFYKLFSRWLPPSPRFEYFYICLKKYFYSGALSPSLSQLLQVTTSTANCALRRLANLIHLPFFIVGEMFPINYLLLDSD